MRDCWRSHRPIRIWHGLACASCAGWSALSSCNTADVLCLALLPDNQILAKITAHTRQCGLFGAFAAQITLLQAYLAHATGQSASALDLYRVAAFLAASAASSSGSSALASRNDLVKSARLGEAGLLIGLGRAAEVCKEARTLARDVWGGPTTTGVAAVTGGRSQEANVGLRIAGGLVLGVLEEEILRSKSVFGCCRMLDSSSPCS